MSLICKNRHVYAVPHKVVCKKIVEEADADGYPVQRYENVNMLSHKAVETPDVSNFSLETQLAANQPIKRISTISLEPDEISVSQLSQLAERFEEARENQTKTV